MARGVAECEDLELGNDFVGEVSQQPVKDGRAFDTALKCRIRTTFFVVVEESALRSCMRPWRMS